MIDNFTGFPRKIPVIPGKFLAFLISREIKIREISNPSTLYAYCPEFHLDQSWIRLAMRWILRYHLKHLKNFNQRNWNWNLIPHVQASNNLNLEKTLPLPNTISVPAFMICQICYKFRAHRTHGYHRVPRRKRAKRHMRLMP